VQVYGPAVRVDGAIWSGSGKAIVSPVFGA
jgi:hypothetical protein